MAGNAVEITDANFDETILNADGPALVDFWAVWCGPCRVVGPIVEEIAEDYAGRVVVGKLDVDANRDTAVKYGIQAIPTLLLVNNGEVADRIVGVFPNVKVAVSEVRDPRSYRVRFTRIQRQWGFNPDQDVDSGVRQVADFLRREKADAGEPRFHNDKSLRALLEETPE